MKQKTIYIITAILLIIISAIGGYKSGSCGDKTITVKDTIVVKDTIRINNTVPVTKIFTRYEKLTDTVRINDTVYFPMMHLEYSSPNYKAWVSGYHATLDSIDIYSSNNIVIKKLKKKRFGLGIIGGYGYGTHGFSPYIGLGLYYRIF